MLIAVELQILIEIFGYLNYADKLEASLTCRRWFDILQSQLQRRITFQKVSVLSDTSEPLSTFLNSFQTYQAVTIDNVELADCERFWQLFNEQIEDLEIIDPEIKQRQFVEAVRHLTQLTSLRLISCRDLFMSNKILCPGESHEYLRVALQNLRHLGIVDNRYLSDAFFSRLTTLMPNLESLDLTGCQISFHKGLYRKFYPQNNFEKGASESILTFHFVHDFIRSNSATIKKLNFSKTLIDGDALEKLVRTPGLQLKELHLASCDQLTNTGLLALAETQVELEVLDVSSCVRVTDQSVISFAKNLPCLKILRLKLCRAVTDLGITELKTLPYLEEVDVSGCEFVTGQGIESLFKEENQYLRRLHLGALSNIHESSVIKLVEMVKNLTVLNLTSSRSGVTNKAAQEIFVHATKLRELNLDFCDNVTDAGLLGMDLTEEKKSQDDDMRSPVPPMNDFKISLRSRAEQEIVNDAALKNTMRTMCEAQEGNINLSRSIANLKGLVVLKLTGCNKVTDVSLVYCFKFLELRSLTLAKCHQVRRNSKAKCTQRLIIISFQISTTGIQEVAKSCPSLQVLNMSECQSIDDKAVRFIANNVKRLKELYIDRCHKLSDHSLDAIAMECKVLKVLDVRGCRGMCPEPGLQLKTLTSLKNLMTSKPGPYFENKSGFMPQAPSFRLS